jgi:hypothetical protein
VHHCTGHEGEFSQADISESGKDETGQQCMPHRSVFEPDKWAVYLSEDCVGVALAVIAINPTTSQSCMSSFGFMPIRHQL